jgi:hypothetical protein
LRESRETTTKYQSLITDHADLVGKYEALRDEHHNQEIDHAAVKAEKIWMEKRVADLEVSLEFERTRGNKHK